MASELENQLVDGGISPSAAKIIANAIDNAATGRLTTGRQMSDNTPVQRMRQINAADRRNLFSNLDYSDSVPLSDRLAVDSTFQNPFKDHPYRDRQPATSNPTLETPTVKAGNYVEVGQNTEKEVAQSEVALNVEDKQGEHARLNKSTGKVESVPISVVVEPKGLLEAQVVEEEGRTLIKITVVNTALKELLGKRFGSVTSVQNHSTTQSGTGIYLFVENKAVHPNDSRILVQQDF